MKRAIGNLMRVTLLATALGALAYGATTAYAAHASTGRTTCHLCSSQQQCQTCCEDLGYDTGTCTMAGACLCS